MTPQDHDHSPLAPGDEPTARIVLRDREAVTVCVSGQIDNVTAPALRSCLARCLSEGFTLITVDMRSLEFIDFAGIRPLVWTDQRLRSRRGRLVLQSPPSWAQEVLAVSGLTPFLSVDTQPPL